MLFAMNGRDKTGHLDVRLRVRPEHVAFLDDLNARGVLKFAGPYLEDDGKPCGSLVVIEASDKAAAEQVFRNDPYARAGLFETVTVQAWNWVFNKPQDA
jgi:uncharacterized protein YciI